MFSIDLASFAAAARWSDLPDYVESARFAATCTMANFPGAILPALSQDDRLLWYAVADSSRGWRRLNPLLVSFVGATVTPFRGRAVQFSREIPREMQLISAGAVAGARLVPAPQTAVLANRSLLRLLALYEGKPAHSAAPPISTRAMLAHFDMSLATGDRALAERWLGALRNEWRLDETNLLFAETRLLFTFRDWKRIATAPWLQNLVYVDMPQLIAHAIVEALWNFHLEPLKNSSVRMLETYEDLVRPLVRPLIHAVGPQVSQATFAIIELEASASGQQITIAHDPPKSSNSGWQAWLADLPYSQESSALIAARELLIRDPVDEWKAGDKIGSFAQGLTLAADGANAATLREVLPTLVEWLRGDPSYPRRALRPIYESIFTLLALLPSPERAERSALVEILDALNTIGVTRSDYTQQLEDINESIGEGAGLSTVDWLFEIAETLIRQPAPNEGARAALLTKVVASIQPLTGLLRQEQRAAYRRLAVSTGWPPLPQPVQHDAVNIWSRLANQTIAIYSLTETAARRASEVLVDLEPAVRIELTADHVCSERLQVLSSKADIFVLTWLSAKHAATDCIKQYRRKGPLLYSAGRGFTGIIRAISEHLEGGRDAAAPSP